MLYTSTRMQTKLSAINVQIAKIEVIGKEMGGLG